ncbi:NUDIX domain-containing protein [Candidatus Berkiella aquae]|uniref:NUDIX domain-containing protein n=1 Tax=Candidatus Berkiella aquae TaxID=295108 RepID=A0A0Q9YB86_9GAMM|nr:NUDIX domain-containing protein [Candidatus Berkiella aquae]MCS5710621.1 NUDIX domain-containing protein [Candidatus Berkiella aquae]
MKNEEGIHVLARAVIIENNRLLVTTDIKRQVSFLPGGHIHYGEKSKEALQRELLEELGEAFMVNNLLGVVEDGWDYKGALYHGIHLIFSVDAAHGNLISRLTSQENELILSWIDINKLDTINLFPKLLVRKIPQWLKTSGIEVATEWTWV